MSIRKAGVDEMQTIVKTVSKSAAYA